MLTVTFTVLCLVKVLKTYNGMYTSKGRKKEDSN